MKQIINFWFIGVRYRLVIHYFVSSKPDGMERLQACHSFCAWMFRNTKQHIISSTYYTSLSVLIT